MKTHPLPFYVLFGIVAIYHSVAAAAWQSRNPKANEITLWTYYLDVITFKKLETFQ